MTKGQLEAKISKIVSKFEIEYIMNVAIISTHSDISTKTGEKIIVITVDRNLEEIYKTR